MEELINMRGAYTWIKTSVKEKEEEGSGLIGKEIVCSSVQFK